jgi:uncharacterized membrane protein YeaQ/YmgE (transglycosylase-associated protein family)
VGGGQTFRRRPPTGTTAPAHPSKELTVHVSGFVTAIFVGLIIGALGRLVLPGRQNIGILLTILIGIVAAILGTVVAGALGVANTRGIDWIELLLQVIFAAIGVGLVAGLRGRRS